MSVEADLVALMLEVVQVEPYTGLNADAEAEHGARQSYRCRIERRPKLVRSTEGREVVSNARVFFETATNIDPRSKVLLPDGSTTPILHVERLFDERGAYADVVYL